jgi:hypothetical protein
MATNKGCRPDPKTMPVTKEYAEGHARIFKNKRRQPGRYVWDSEKSRMVPLSEYVVKDSNYHAKPMVFTDRYMEGLVTYDTKEDIGTRRKRKEYMERHGLVDPQDSVQMKAKLRNEWGQMLAGTHAPTNKQAQETFGRKLYEIESRKRRTGR